MEYIKALLCCTSYTSHAWLEIFAGYIPRYMLLIYATHQFSYFIRVQIVPRPIRRVGVAIATSANLTRFHFLIIITLARTLRPWHSSQSPSGKG